MHEPKTETSAELPKGFDCVACGRFNRFPAYVYAHWREVLTTSCECGARYEIVLGRVDRIDEEERKP